MTKKVTRKKDPLAGGVYLMEANGFTCGINMPASIHSENDDIHLLPPYNKRNGFLVDAYPACPDNWMRSEGRLTSYFVPVLDNHGLWLDFNQNASHNHHIAIVISVQGINPITGMPCSDPQLEQYIDECPKHKTKFGPNRYCEKCGYKWPKQNYICTNATPHGQFWLDGFRAVDGVVRQYILTQEKMRGVASNIIGSKRVYAIGISFFLSKDKKPEPTTTIFRGNYDNWSPYEPIPDGGSAPSEVFWNLLGGTVNHNSKKSSGEITIGKSEQTYGFTATDCSDMNGVTKCCLSSTGVQARSATMFLGSKDKPQYTKSLDGKVQCKKLEVGAGAKISQQVYDDPEHLDFWHDEYEAMICINYCSEEDAHDIIERGSIDLTGSPEGFLADIPVGN